MAGPVLAENPNVYFSFLLLKSDKNRKYTNVIMIKMIILNGITLAYVSI